MLLLLGIEHVRIEHRPDLPLPPFGSTRAALGLWNQPMATILVESAMFGLGVCIYMLYTRARNLTGHLALWALVLVLALLYAADVTSPPPPSVRAIAIGGLTGWLAPPRGDTSGTPPGAAQGVG